MNFRTSLQLAEAFGSLNRWFCCEFHCREIDDRDLLLAYYIKSGAARAFAARYDEAMGKENRWYCSEFHGREIRDPEILWDYYINIAPRAAMAKRSRSQSVCVEAELSLS